MNFTGKTALITGGNADRAGGSDLSNPFSGMACKRELTRRVNLSPSTCPYSGKYGSFRRPPVPRKPMLPAQRQRTQITPTAEPRRRPEPRDKPEEQPGLLWNKFRSEPVD